MREATILLRVVLRALIVMSATVGAITLLVLGPRPSIWGLFGGLGLMVAAGIEFRQQRRSGRPTKRAEGEEGACQS